MPTTNHPGPSIDKTQLLQKKRYRPNRKKPSKQPCPHCTKVLRPDTIREHLLRAESIQKHGDRYHLALDRPEIDEDGDRNEDEDEDEDRNEDKDEHGDEDMEEEEGGEGGEDFDSRVFGLSGSEMDMDEAIPGTGHEEGVREERWNGDPEEEDEIGNDKEDNEDEDEEGTEEEGTEGETPSQRRAHWRCQQRTIAEDGYGCAFWPQPQPAKETQEPEDGSDDDDLMDDDMLEEMMRERFGSIVMEDLYRTAQDDLDEDDIEGLRAFYFYKKARLTKKAFELYRATSYPKINVDSLWRILKRLDTLAHLELQEYECCIKSCVNYSCPTYEGYVNCPECNEPRYGANGRPRRTWTYIPLIPRLQAMQGSDHEAKRMQFRATRDTDEEVISSIFDAEEYRKKWQRRVKVDGQTLRHCYYSDPRDVALGFYTDGFQIFKRGDYDCWLGILSNLNLSPIYAYHWEDMLPTFIIPGKNHPKNPTSFHYPLVQETKEMARGFPSFDAISNQPFVQHGYVEFIGADGPALADTIKVKGANGVFCCHACKIKGILCGTHYYPCLTPPSDLPSEVTPQSYDPLNLPMRTHTEFVNDAINVEQHPNHTLASKSCGINGLSIWSEVPGFDMVRSSPIEPMHCLFENNMKNLLSLWFGNFKGLTGPFVLSIQDQEDIANELCEAHHWIPSSMGRPMPHILTHAGDWTAEDFLNFALFAGQVVLRGRLPVRYYNHFMRFRAIIVFGIAWGMKKMDLGPNRVFVARWVQDYEINYYGYKHECLIACPSNLHKLLHLIDYITWKGPIWCYWSFCLERACGIVKAQIRSRVYPYVNIRNYLVQMQQFMVVRARHNLHQQFITKPPPSAFHQTVDLAKRIGDYQCTLKVPFDNYILDRNPRIIVRRYLASRFGLSIQEVESGLPQVVFCAGKCVMDASEADTLTAIVSQPSRGGMARDSTFVEYTLLVERAGSNNQDSILIPEDFFGQIQRIITFTYKDEELILFLIRRAKTQKHHPFNLNSWNGGWGSLDVVDAKCVVGLRGRIKRKSEWWFVARGEDAVRAIYSDNENLAGEAARI